MSETSRRSGEELLRLELDRLRRETSGLGLVAHAPATPPTWPAQAKPAAQNPRRASAHPVGNVLAVALILVAGAFLFRLTSWLFDFPTEMLDARSDAPMSADQFQFLLVFLAVLVALVVFANVIVAIWATCGAPPLHIRQVLGYCGVLAAALVAYPWDATFWLSESGGLPRHVVRDAAAVLLAAAATFWLHPKAPRSTGSLIMAVIVWELLSPYLLGWSEKIHLGWLGVDPDSGEHALRLISYGLAAFAVLVGLVLVIRGESGRRRIWHVLLGAPALVVGAILLLPWARLLWADPTPQPNQLLGWALAGALFVTLGVLLLAQHPEQRD